MWKKTIILITSFLIINSVYSSEEKHHTQIEWTYVCDTWYDFYTTGEFNVVIKLESKKKLTEQEIIIAKTILEKVSQKYIWKKYRVKLLKEFQEALGKSKKLSKVKAIEIIEASGP